MNGATSAKLEPSTGQLVVTSIDCWRAGGVRAGDLHDGRHQHFGNGSPQLQAERRRRRGQSKRVNLLKAGSASQLSRLCHPFAVLVRLGRRALEWHDDARQRARDSVDLYAMSARELNDIGIGRGEIGYTVSWTGSTRAKSWFDAHQIGFRNDFE